MKPGIAVIGLGIMGSRMLGSLTKHGGYNLVTAWDPSPEALAATGSTYPNLVLADSATAAIENPAVDVVYIASPPAAHYDYSLAAAKLGKLVYCEKPLGVDLATSEALVETVAEHGVGNAVNYIFAAAPAIDLLLAELQGDLLGDVTSVDVRLHFTQWPRAWQEAASWLAKNAEGGFVREVGSHFIFLAEKLFGRATLRSSKTTYPEDVEACETRFVADLDCSGIPVSLAGSGGDPSITSDIVEFTIHGSKRSIRLSDWRDVAVSQGDSWEPVEVGITQDLDLANERFFDEFLSLVAGEPNTIASFEDALSVQRIVEAILRSS